MSFARRDLFFAFLRELLRFHREAPAGGSEPVRDHMRAVARELESVLRSDPAHHPPEPRAKPVCRHLPRLLECDHGGPTADALRAFGRLAPLLRWRWGYADTPEHLKPAFAYAEVLGPHGPVAAEHMVAGVVLLAPDTLYPDHFHQGITESYICLGGAVSRNDDGACAPGSLLFIPPDMVHRLATGPEAPCLLAYAWTGPPQDLASPRMAFA
ncbi:dimethylsulfonioproprionate lyase family protein [Desulfohalovibrio reitneri]|uniref:dimethylsulfonioproprionate lyase family protein n=1 Tax=Desulfohalovibrio reitneri TaxID=1307759 RepID=UPI0004A7737F|nr:dimethylsulfonioproprionate lyase family protein [Desulfohalovibrio reitneri]